MKTLTLDLDSGKPLSGFGITTQSYRPTVLTVGTSVGSGIKLVRAKTKNT